MEEFIKNLNFNYNVSSISGLNNELKSLFLLGYKKEKGNSILLVANTLYEANLLYKSISKHYKNTYLFPMDDFLTSVAVAISPELKTTRLETLNAIVSHEEIIVITNLMGYLRYLPKKDNYKKSFLKLRVNEQYDITKLAETLYDMGYHREVVTNATGEMSLRGYVIDVFAVDKANPIRIEFWGDEIESIKSFDVNTQLTKESLDEVAISPNIELANIKLPVSQCSNFSSIADYINNCQVVYNNYHDIEVSYKLLLEEIHNYKHENNIDASLNYMFELVPAENALYFNEFSNGGKTLEYKVDNIDNFQGDNDAILLRLRKYLAKNKIVIICVSSRYQANKIIDISDEFIFTDINNLVFGKVNIIVKNIASGFIYNGFVVISEDEIFNRTNVNSIYHSNFKIGTKIRDISKLNEGDYVVHQTHGIGKYLGIKVLQKNGLKKDYLMIEYKGGDKLYIPVEKIYVITKYSSGDEIEPKLNKLGGVEWAKTKLRVKKQASGIAKELLRLYAEREKKIGFAFQKDGDEQIEFEKEFVFEATPDQIRVTDEVKKDMESAHPMDRLICGDVGFGKTEIAFRAIFKAIMSGKQAAILCPTTILSEQHYQNALSRFSTFPVNIAILNRFVSPKKVSKTLDDLKNGRVDLIIGTHRVLSDDVEFKNLGLLVVDEEQRFGVKHKEKIKEYKNNIDVLSLSATPIPRTLQMSMSGLRSLSLLETPPQNRYPVQTYVLENNSFVIKDAIYKELSRGGQIFILYNSIEKMEAKLAEISALVPHAKIVTAHGQLSKTELENRMFDFINKKYDVLLCTTIIETGIDIPNVNTLIILDADNYGLSQLYQIRGRVGRSDKIAYCYLMYDKGKILTEQATKRLKVIKDFTELGSGFSIAMRDMQIRGAGNILGSEQSGYIDSVGIELFMKILADAIKNGDVEEEAPEENTESLVEVETNIADSYVEESELKIQIHKAINEINDLNDIANVTYQLEDRFGTLPDTVRIYMYETLFEKKSKALGITEVKQTKNSIELTLSKELTSQIDGEKLFVDLYTLSNMFRLSMRMQRIVVILDIIKLDKHFIYYLLDMLDVIKGAIKK